MRPDDSERFEVMMMALPTEYCDNLVIERDYCTETEYFAWQGDAFERWEWVPDQAATGEPRWGFLRVIHGETPWHSATAVNLMTSIHNAWDAVGSREYRMYPCSLKVHAADGRTTYPDVSIVRGKPKLYADRDDTVINPILLAEVLSPSTDAYDRGEKWLSYQTIPPLQYYLLVSADRARIEVFTRQEQEWHFDVHEGRGARLPLPGLALTVSLTDVYDLVDFEDSATDDI